MHVRISILLVSVSLLSFAGCGQPKVSFTPNRVAQRAMMNNTIGEDETLSPALFQQIANIQAALFGTPDEPHFVANGTEEGLLTQSNLQLAAGAVTGDRLDASIDTNRQRGRGLYREHCVHCHGINGDGRGPTAAFLNPYPRDFTLGKFKFNSTRIGIPSTDDDLHRVIMNGVNGTAMPSFALLDRGEVDALVDYVKYLAIRGQMERLLTQKAGELDPEAGEDKIEETNQNIIGTPDDDGLAMIVETWQSAERAVEPSEPNVPIYSQDRRGWSEEKSNELFDSVDRGRALYYTAKANCFSCHGTTQLGDGNLALYDDWSKELYNWQTDTDDDGSKKAEFMRLGGLSPRTIRPRNLRMGQYRGGRRPVDIFYRIHNGIDGTGMPAANGLSHDDIWDITNYVLSLPFEKTSRPDVDLPTNGRILN